VAEVFARPARRPTSCDLVGKNSSTFVPWQVKRQKEFIIIKAFEKTIGKSKNNSVSHLSWHFDRS